MTTRRILLGVDLNITGHTWLIQRAAWYADQLGAQVDLVFVAAVKAAEHEAVLQGLLTLLPEPVRGRARVESGDAAERLIELTEEYDLLVVGPREPAALQRWLLGPMAVRVMQRSRCPILVPRGDREAAEPLRLLVGLDIHGHGRSAIVDFSISWARMLSGRLDGIYALPHGLPAIANREFREEAMREFMASNEPTRHELVKAMQVIPESLRGTAVLRAGEPEDVLVDASKEYDVVLVGNRGRSGLSKLLLGNVANHVVRTAACDVIVLPTTAT